MWMWMVDVDVDVIVDEEGGRRRVQPARPQVLGGCTETIGQSRRPERGTPAAQNNISKKCSVTCRRQLSHIPNLVGLEGSLTSLAAAMASHEKLHRSQVRPIAVWETRRRVRPKSHGCSPRDLCSRSSGACNKSTLVRLGFCCESKAQQLHHATSRQTSSTHASTVAPTLGDK